MLGIFCLVRVHVVGLELVERKPEKKEEKKISIGKLNQKQVLHETCAQNLSIVTESVVMAVPFCHSKKLSWQ